MDNGEVIQGLNESWTMLGAKLGEWAAGFSMFMISSELFFKKTSTAMPALLLIWISTTAILATLRSRFPDEERGLMNFCLVLVGINPPNIPSPANLQPLWSGAPIKEMKRSREYVQLNLDEIFKEVEQA